MKAAKKILVTGTDTNVGKTYVSCSLIRFFKENNLRVKALKPLESGISDEATCDSALLHKSLGDSQDLESVSLYKLPEPLSPHIAARRANVDISIDLILERIEKLSAECDVLIVEGAGGLLVPILDDYTFADLAKDADLLVLVVAGSKLGVINHLKLSLEVAHSRDLDVLPYILNEGLSDEGGLAVETNKEAIRSSCKVSMLASVSNDSEICWAVDQPLSLFSTV